LLIPDAEALRQMVGLWRSFQAGETLPLGFAPWRNLFAQLRDLRPWGAQDRLSPEDRAVLMSEAADAAGMVRIELELVFRPEAAGVENEAHAVLSAAGGQSISRSRIEGAKYHALLVDIPQAELQRVLDRGQQGLVAAESVMHIRPQSALHISAYEAQGAAAGGQPPLPQGEPIVAVFDAVPLAAHPRLVGRLSLDDPFGLEPLAVGPRLHGTAMASAVVHGNIADQSSPPLARRVFFVNLLFAPQDMSQEERFPDRLPADLFHEAVVRLKSGDNATAPNVIVINASLGDRNKPFTGRISGWARVVDFLSYAHGVLFIISAGNHVNDLVDPSVSTVAFEALTPEEKARVALRASGAAIAHRRILAPAESMNALTVGALNSDSVPSGVLPAGIFDVWLNTGLCTVSSGLGPGLGNATKPDVLSTGGRHHVRLLPSGTGHLLRPIGKNSSLGGILVATPPSAAAANPDAIGRTVGTSVAAGLLSGVAARAHEALEDAYGDDFLSIARVQRAMLLKALLVHCARWGAARDLIIEVLGPSDNKQHVRQKDNVRRYLGYGAVDAGLVLDCATDRATLWAVGNLQSDQAHTYLAPLAFVMSGKAQLHELSATVAWVAPPRVGSLSYRGVRLQLVEPNESAALLAVSAVGQQPDTKQTHRGTVIHRRWAGEKAAALAANSGFELMVQRAPDEIDDPIPYAIVATLTMPGVAEVYAQVRNRVAIKPKIPVQS
jgi:hypothetical protein